MLSPGSLFMELSCFNISLQICSFCSMRKEAINKTNYRHLYTKLKIQRFLNFISSWKISYKNKQNISVGGWVVVCSQTLLQLLP